MSEELERIVVAKRDTGIIIFQRSVGGHQQYYGQNPENAAQLINSNTNKMPEVLNGPGNKDPEYWKMHSPLNRDDFEALVTKLREYKSS